MRYQNAFTATLSAVQDRIAKPNRPRPLSPDERLDGQTALVTGATGGLGTPVAERLAARGAKVIAAARSSSRELVERIEDRGGAALDETVDLADLRSVDALVDSIEDELSLVVVCAALVAKSSRPTAQGFDVVIGVNYIAHAYLLQRLIATGKLRRGRVVVVASEAHRSADAFDLAGLGTADDWSISQAVARYGYSKALLIAWALEASRRWAPDIAVHAICPGPVDSRIAREAPGWAQPLLGPVMRTFFSPAALAAEPVVYLAAARELEGRTGVYLHRWVEKETSELTRDEAVAARLWDRTEELLRERSEA